MQEASRACDLLAISLDVVRKSSKKSAQKKARIGDQSDGWSQPFTAEQTQFLVDLELMVRRLVPEGRIAQRLCEARDKLDSKVDQNCDGSIVSLFLFCV